MKRIAVTLLAAMAATAAQAAERQTRIEVGELSCPSCPYIAASAIEGIESTTIVDSEYDPSAMMAIFVVSYDDAVTTPEAIAAASQEYGYPGRVLGLASDS